MDRPYMSECIIPDAREPAFFVKKLTVKGNSGYIQGISTAVNPPISPVKNIAHKDLGLSLVTAFTTGAFLACAACAFLRIAILSAAVGMLVN